MIAVAPLLICFFTAILCLFFKKNIRVQRFVSILGSVILFTLASILLYQIWQTRTVWITQMGGWPAPFGISFYLDTLSIVMIFISAFLSLGVNIFSLGATEDKQVRWGFHSLYHFMMMGVVGSFCTADLFNLYVWFEVLLLASFGLIALSDAKNAIKANLKYVILNLFGSFFFLFGLGLLYSSSGTLNFADILAWSQITPQGEMIPIVAILLLVAFLMKAGAFPFYQWLPSSYPAVEVSALAIFSGLLTKVGVYVVIRFFAGGLPINALDMKWLFGVSAGLTMLLGVWGAAVQMSGRKILSFHIISQIGYILMGVAMFSLAGISAAVFYLIHHMVVKTNLFLVMGWLHTNYSGDDLPKLGEMAKRHPWIAVGFVIPALSLAGIPPFSGFWAKLLVIQSALEKNSFVLVAVSLFVGLLTLYSMSKIWNEVFLKKSGVSLIRNSITKRQSWAMGLPIFVFCLWTVFMGVMPERFLHLSQVAALGVLDTSQIQKNILQIEAESD